MKKIFLLLSVMLLVILLIILGNENTANWKGDIVDVLCEEKESITENEDNNSEYEQFFYIVVRGKKGIFGKEETFAFQVEKNLYEKAKEALDKGISLREVLGDEDFSTAILSKMGYIYKVEG